MKALLKLEDMPSGGATTQLHIVAHSGGLMIVPSWILFAVQYLRDGIGCEYAGGFISWG